jgi:class 3 adenylate cyclase
LDIDSRPPGYIRLVRCLSCGQESPAGFRFCGSCGTALTEAAPVRETRKVVSVVFCDLSGSTALGERTDPEALRTRMRGYYERMRQILERHGGTVEKFIGDAVMAVFGVPVAHEDDAMRAVRAAWEMRAAVPRLGLRARIGVNTGEVVAGEGDTLVTGDAVNVAARLEQLAEIGEVLIGGETRQLVRDAVQVEPVQVAAKGKAEPVAAYRLLNVDLAAAAVARRLDTPLIGRRPELQQLRQAFERSVREQVAADGGVPLWARRHRVDRPVSGVRRGDHVLAGRLGPQAAWRAGGGNPRAAGRWRLQQGRAVLECP